MQIPLEISYHNISKTQWLDDYIKERVAHLEHICDGLISCRVLVERLQHQHRTGNPYRARVEVTLPPRKEIIGDKEGVVEDMQVQLRPIIRRAFDALEKQLKKYTATRRGEVKHHDEPRALIVRLFPDDDYGFIKSPTDGEEYYFHRNAVLHNDFDRLTLGTEVRFEAEMGEKGPQASSVQIVSKPSVRAQQSGRETLTQPAGWERS